MYHNVSFWVSNQIVNFDYDVVLVLKMTHFHLLIDTIGRKFGTKNTIPLIKVPTNIMDQKF